MLRTEIRVPSAPVLGDMAFEVKLSAFGDEALATLLAAAFDAIATCFCGHACAETVLLFTGAFCGLVGAEAHDGSRLERFCAWMRGGGTLVIASGLSMRQCGVFGKKYIRREGFVVVCRRNDKKYGSYAKYDRLGLRLRPDPEFEIHAG